MQAAQTVPVMVGGMREILSDFSSKQKYYIDTALGIAIVIGIVFVHEVSPHIRNQLDTFVGRLFAFLLLALVADQIGWIHGLLLAIFLALVLSLSTNARHTYTEGFTPDFQVRVVPKKQRWWIEEVMKENPIGIEDEKVNTSAIQDDSVNNRNSQQDTKSSSQ
jgi:hypothetical protein